MHVYLLGIRLIWSRRSGWDLRLCISGMLLGSADIAYLLSYSLLVSAGLLWGERITTLSTQPDPGHGPHGGGQQEVLTTVCHLPYPTEGWELAGRTEGRTWIDA